MNENNEFLVSTEWLEKSLNNPDICIVDCDPYDAFGRAHILGAVGIKVHHYIKHPDYSKSPKRIPLRLPNLMSQKKFLKIWELEIRLQ